MADADGVGMSCVFDGRKRAHADMAASRRSLGWVSVWACRLRLFLRGCGRRGERTMAAAMLGELPERGIVVVDAGFPSRHMLGDIAMKSWADTC